MQQEKLVILNGALASLGITTTIQMLHTIFEISILVEEKGEELNLREIRELAKKIADEYARR